MACITYTWGCMCSIGQFKYRWLKGYIWLMLLSSSNRKYPPFPLFSYFSVVVCLKCLLHHILSLIVYRSVFISIVQFMMIANSGIRFGFQIVCVCLYITPSHYHNCANFIWRHWTYTMPVRYNLSRVWVRLSIFSQLSIIQYVGLCVFSLPISFVMIQRIYIYFVLLSSSNRKYELLPIV